MTWRFLKHKMNCHGFRVERTWSFPYEDWSMLSMQVRWSQIKGAQGFAICYALLHPQAVSLGPLQMLLSVRHHSQCGADMVDFLLCFVLLLLLIFPFAYRCLVCRFPSTLGEHGAYQESPQRLNQTCLWVLVSGRGTGQQWPAAGTGALGAADLGVA